MAHPVRNKFHTVNKLGLCKRLCGRAQSDDLLVRVLRQYRQCGDAKVRVGNGVRPFDSDRTGQHRVTRRRAHVYMQRNL
jgi:hypothetical protein